MAGMGGQVQWRSTLAPRHRAPLSLDALIDGFPQGAAQGPCSAPGAWVLAPPPPACVEAAAAPVAEATPNGADQEGGCRLHWRALGRGDGEVGGPGGGDLQGLLAVLQSELDEVRRAVREMDKWPRDEIMENCSDLEVRVSALESAPGSAVDRGLSEKVDHLERRVRAADRRTDGLLERTGWATCKQLPLDSDDFDPVGTLTAKSARATVSFSAA